MRLVTASMNFSPAILLLIALFVVALPVAAWAQLARATVEKPDFKVLHEGDDYEIRQYPPCIVAQVTIEGDPSEAMNDGFSPLADFIFGANEPEEKIAMTTPVTMEPEEKKGEKIAMTTPVTQEPADSEANAHVVSFIMPSEYTLDELPKPTNDRVVLKEVPARTLAVHRFSWTGAHHHMRDHEKELRAQLAEDGIEVTGDPIYARYDPPWTLPIFRRNEVMLPVAWDDAPETE